MGNDKATSWAPANVLSAVHVKEVAHKSTSVFSGNTSVGVLVQESKEEVSRGSTAMSLHVAPFKDPLNATVFRSMESVPKMLLSMPLPNHLSLLLLLKISISGTNALFTRVLAAPKTYKQSMRMIKGTVMVREAPRRVSNIRFACCVGREKNMFGVKMLFFTAAK